MTLLLNQCLLFWAVNYQSNKFTFWILGAKYTSTSGKLSFCGMLFLLRKQKHKLLHLKLLFLHCVLCSALPLGCGNIFRAHLRLANCTPPTFVNSSAFCPRCWYFEHKILLGHLGWGFPFFINYLIVTTSCWKLHLVRNCHMKNVFVEWNLFIIGGCSPPLMLPIFN